MTKHATQPTTDPIALRQAALRLLRNDDELAEATVEFSSGGHLLIIGPFDAAIAAAGRLESLPRRTLLVSSVGDRAKLPAGVDCYTGRVESLSGHLGAFRVTAEIGGRTLDLATVDGGEAFDLVLDLGPGPLLAMALRPAGYFFPDGAIAEAEAELIELVGTFEKPRYISYDPDRCLHGANGTVGCTRCLDLCPAWAVRPDGNEIAIDTHLCQGAGSCATVCPSDAIRYQFPTALRLRERHRSALRDYSAAGGEPPTLLIHDAGTGRAQIDRIEGALPAAVLPLQLEELAAAGIESWLSLLAWGARELLLLGHAGLPAAVVALLEQETGLARHLLEGIGYDPDLIRLLEPQEDDALIATLAALPARNPIAIAPFAAVQAKRDQLRLALDHLVDHAPAPHSVVALPAGAPFGTVHLDRERCTLCMACTGVCRASALMTPGDTPRLDFIEHNCVQCGLCVATCPEQALELEPRYLCDGEARAARRTLKEDEPFRCVSCGTPFATQGVIASMAARLADHPMFAGTDARRLRMCPDCRVRDIFNDRDASGF